MCGVTYARIILRSWWMCAFGTVEMQCLCIECRYNPDFAMRSRIIFVYEVAARGESTENLRPKTHVNRVGNLGILVYYTQRFPRFSACSLVTVSRRSLYDKEAQWIWNTSQWSRVPIDTYMWTPPCRGRKTSGWPSPWHKTPGHQHQT